ncbi:DUF5105 domain-containing protein [Peribacillus sp. NPDC096379]|uniref:DUF5105 domain-containing protein n=1 Tax=Peribacillus sp. NPDC096379 TaxID=3364393 RepID=UPI003805F02D
MKKKGTILLIVIGLIFVLGACSGTDEKASADKNQGKNKNKQLEASIEEASYIVPDIEYGMPENQDQGIIAVKLKIKNLSDSSILLSEYEGVKLYDGDQQINIKPELYNRKIDLNIGTSGNLGAGKAKSFLAIFEVEKDKEYEIGLNPISSNFEEDNDELILKLDTKKYADSYETLQDPAKAFTAYVDQIYYEKENNDYEQFVSADKPAMQEAAKNTFKTEVKELFKKDLTDEEIDKLYISYRDILAEKAVVTSSIAAYANDKAIVAFDITTLPLQELYQEVYEYQKEFRDKTGNYDEKAIDEYVLSKFDIILDSMEMKSSSRKIEVSLMKKNGKWTIDPVNKYGDSLDKIFVKGSVY